MRLTTFRTRRGVQRARRIWAELDYAQRRSLEIQTGLSLGAREIRPQIRAFDELSRLRAA
jgi:hypothetical protein